MLPIRGPMYKTYFNYERKIAEQVDNRLTQLGGTPPSGRCYVKPEPSSGADMIDVFLDMAESSQDKYFESLIGNKIAEYLLSDYTSPEPDYIYRFICMHEKYKLQIFMNCLKSHPNLLKKLLNNRTPENLSLIELARQIDKMPSSSDLEDEPFEFILMEAQKDLCESSIPVSRQEKKERKSLKS